MNEEFDEGKNSPSAHARAEAEKRNQARTLLDQAKAHSDNAAFLRSENLNTDADAAERQAAECVRKARELQ